jgi:hypothetical protein
MDNHLPDFICIENRYIWNISMSTTNVLYATTYCGLRYRSNLANPLSINSRDTVNVTRIFPGLHEWNTDPGP